MSGRLSKLIVDDLNLYCSSFFSTHAPRTERLYLRGGYRGFGFLQRNFCFFELDHDRSRMPTHEPALAEVDSTNLYGVKGKHASFMCTVHSALYSVELSRSSNQRVTMICCCRVQY